VQNNNEYNPNGTRKIGTVTLRARKGSSLNAMGISFADYFKSYTGEPLPTSCSSDGEDAGVAPPPSLDSGAPEPPSGGKGGIGGSAGKGGSGGGPGPDDYLCETAFYLRPQYDSLQLELLAEAVAGGAPGDSQPCIGDQGGPLARKDSTGKLTVYGVVIGGVSSQKLQCDDGAVYATFDQSVIDFIDQAKKWVDPCAGLSTLGQCDGSVASRCTNVAEGPRRKVAFDCAQVDLTCQTQQYDGSIGCGQNTDFFQPAPAVVSTQKVDATSIGRELFRAPQAFVKR
jgi:hypothetical protein